MLSLLLSRDTGDEQRVFDRMLDGLWRTSAGRFRGAIKEQEDESVRSRRDRKSVRGETVETNIDKDEMERNIAAVRASGR